MAHRDDRDDREPDILFPSGRPVRRTPPSRRPLVIFGVLFALFLFFHNAVPLYTDWLWFREVGYTGVFATTIATKTGLFFGFGALFFVLFWGSVRLARHLMPETSDRALMERFGPEWGRALQRYLDIALLGIAAFLSLWAGRIAAEQWLNWRTWLHAMPFGQTDPVFHNDIGFYVFRLPFWEWAQSWLLGTLILTLLATVVIHVVGRGIESWAGLPDVRSGIRSQLLTLFALLALVLAWGRKLDTYSLLFADNGVFSGAGYTDLHYRLFALNTQIAILLLTALACLVTLFRGRGFVAPLYGGAAYVAAVVVLGVIVPNSAQKVQVEPNQFDRERPYIARNIAATRQGFNLQNVRVASFPAASDLTGAQIAANQDTLANVRLWDYPYLGKVYAQLQNIKSYYKFEMETVSGGRAFNLDVDRYTLNGKLQQVMLGGREMDTDALSDSAKTWQNQRLGYTHGYGIVASPVSATLGGDPAYLVQGFPPVTAAPGETALNVSRPEIYYGQLEHSYVMTDTHQQEFDYPSTGGGAGGGGQDHYSTYGGKGGIVVGDSYLRRLAFAARLGDQNILLSGSLTPRTRLLYRRDIRDRVQTIAPWLQQDGDPYLVIGPAGRLTWLIDCYTLSDRYPYSTPFAMPVSDTITVAPNYLRNSIKATIDAYDGTVNFYLADAADPIARTYGAMFPGLLKPLSALPAELRSHLRYPEDLFRVQRTMYAAYHVADPRIFYLREDLWAIPNEPNTDASSQNAPRQMEPYYVIMRLPNDLTPQPPSLIRVAALAGKGEKEAEVEPSAGSHLPQGGEEFVLMSPLAPVKKEDQNILGWMCARCDPAHYGELVLYRFPQQASIEGPSQIVQRINSDRVISPQLSLLRSGGSTATLGNLLVIPIETSLLYIAPLYVESSTSDAKLPKLQKVIVATGSRVAMEDTLERALASLFPPSGDVPTNPPPSSSTPSPTEGNPPKPDGKGSGSGPIAPALRGLIEQAGRQYDAAQNRLKAGDFAGYGAATRQLQQTLTRLRDAAR